MRTRRCLLHDRRIEERSVAIHDAVSRPQPRLGIVRGEEASILTRVIVCTRSTRHLGAKGIRTEALCAEVVEAENANGVSRKRLQVSRASTDSTNERISPEPDVGVSPPLKARGHIGTHPTLMNHHQDPRHPGTSQNSAPQNTDRTL